MPSKSCAVCPAADGGSREAIGGRSTKVSNAHNHVLGAAPEGALDPDAAARAVREMFTLIAPRYDLLNHILSFNVDRLWWKRTARAFAQILGEPDSRILDLCCGTGDMTFALRQQAGSLPQVLGADFSHAMLQRAHLKSADKVSPNGNSATP